METDIICEGFTNSEVQYGIRYMFVVGDGDSSVMANIRSSVLYGIFVTKIECANHACKAYRSHLEELVRICPQYKGKGGLTKRVMQWLTIGARIAIKYHSKDKSVNNLRHDLRNGPAHVFGDHSKCGSHFCKTSTEQNPVQQRTHQTSRTQKDTNGTIVDTIESIIEEEEEELNEATETDATNAYEGNLDTLPEGLYCKVLACGERLVMPAEHLIDNETSNLAECYMSIRTCFDGGKQFNRIQSGSFENHCYAAGLRIQNGPQWLGETLLESIRTEPGKVRQHNQYKRYEYKLFFIQVLTSYIKKREHQLTVDKQRKQTLKYSLQRKKARYSSSNSTAQNDYGPTSQQPDVSKEELHRLCTEFFEREVHVTEDRASLIEQQTRQQSDDSI